MRTAVVLLCLFAALACFFMAFYHSLFLLGAARQKKEFRPFSIYKFVVPMNQNEKRIRAKMTIYVYLSAIFFGLFFFLKNIWLH
jgi:predicted secreted protein